MRWSCAVDRGLAVVLVLLWPLAGQAADGIDFLGVRPVDAATQAVIEELARQAEQVTGTRQEDGAAMLDRAQAAAAALRSDKPVVGLADVMARASAVAHGATASGGPAEVAAGEVSAAARDRDLVVFVSWSMGVEALRETVREAKADGHARVVVRGILAGERIGDAVRRFAPIIREFGAGAGIDFDPPAFRNAGISTVPTIWDPATGSQWRGSVALAAFRRHLADVAAPFSEAVGPAVDVAEADLEEAMRAQAAQLDFTGMREAAYQRYWQRAALLQLPPAGATGERLVDPTVWLTEPIRDARGEVAVPAGTRVNTLETHPWKRRLVVFDCTDPKQVAWAVRRTHDRKPGVYLTSNVDRDAGWEGWKACVSAIGQPLYVLQEQLAARMDVHVVPALVEQEGALLRIREIGPADVRAE